jgi:hypothetical protein
MATKLKYLSISPSPEKLRLTHSPHRQMVKCILTLVIGEPVLQEQHDLPEVLLREHVLVLYDKLDYA